MKRALRRFVSNLKGRNKFVFFTTLILVCILALSIGIYSQYFYKYVESDPLMIGINIGSQKTIEEYAMLEANFNNLFQNNIVINSENVRVDKLEQSKELVYTGYNLVNEDENYYSVNAQVPVLNINTTKAKQINNEIKSDFYDKANSVMRQTDKNIVYSVSYASFINQDILSIVIKSSLKEGDNPEKVVVKTYNYNIPREEIVTLSNLIEPKQTTIDEVQNKINNEIKTAYNNAKIIAAEYGTVYERDLSSDIYKVENIKTFFLTQDGYIYIVYPYGNEEYTNEMDIIIF